MIVASKIPVSGVRATELKQGDGMMTYSPTAAVAAGGGPEASRRVPCAHPARL